MQPPKSTEPPPQQEVKGAVWEKLQRMMLARVPKTGAAAGAIIGGARRRDQKRQQQHAEQQWGQQQTANYTKNRDEYNRAYGACLEGRGYTVKIELT
jgi:hypothetical protein